MSEYARTEASSGVRQPLHRPAAAVAMLCIYYAYPIHHELWFRERYPMRLITRFAALALTLVAVAGLACTAAEATEDAASTPATATGAVRVVHPSPDAPPVDILVNGQPAITDLAFPMASEYAALPADTYAVAVTPAGANDQVVLAAQLPVTADADTT